VSHSETVPLADPETIHFPSGLNATEVASAPWSTIHTRRASAAASQIFALPSPSAVTSFLPSGLKLADNTRSACPSSDAISTPGFASHTFAVSHEFTRGTCCRVRRHPLCERRPRPAQQHRATFEHLCAQVLLPRSVKVTPEQFWEARQLNRDVRLELTAEGDLIVEPLDQPESLSGDPVLPGFVLRLGPIWDPSV
jgi:hypothetical protein